MVDVNIQAAIDLALQAARDEIAALRTDLVAAQAATQAAQQEATAARQAAVVATAAAAAPRAGPAATAPTFALGPATISGNIIDYSTPAGIKLYRMAGDTLKSDFDLDSTNFHQFVDNLNSRAIEQGWDNELLVITQGGNTMNILQNYGSLTYASVLDHCYTYVFRDNRLSQNSTNLFNCLEASLTKEAMVTMYAEKHLYTLNRGVVRQALPMGTIAAGKDNAIYRDGLLLLWAVINRTTAQTNATISAIINQLTRMNTLMEESKHDIKQFNTSVRNLLNQYTANRRHEYDETILINSLFSSYKTTKDKEFTLYITRKQQDHDDNTKIMTPNTLMEDALKMYQTRITIKEWEQDTAEVKEIINLSAQLKSSQGKLAALEKKWENKDKQGEKKNGKGKDNKQYDGLTPEQIRKKRRDAAPGWMKKRPQNPSPSSRLEKDGKTYKWCDKHKMWCYHDTTLVPQISYITTLGTKIRYTGNL